MCAIIYDTDLYLPSFLLFPFLFLDWIVCWFFVFFVVFWYFCLTASTSNGEHSKRHLDSKSRLESVLGTGCFDPLSPVGLRVSGIYFLLPSSSFFFLLLPFSRHLSFPFFFVCFSFMSIIFTFCMLTCVCRTNTTTSPPGTITILSRTLYLLTVSILFNFVLFIHVVTIFIIRLFIYIFSIVNN